MYTGIVQGTCPVTSVASRDGTAALSVDLGSHIVDLQLGASVAVNGTCLTAAVIDGSCVQFDIIKETWQQTNLSDLSAGALVNVERSFRVGDEVGGHILSGHVAAAASVVDVVVGKGHRLVTVAVPERWMPYLMPKGFVALNGASLTIQELDRERSTLTVSLIPETLARTTFGDIAAGDRLNLEVDAQTQAVVDTVRAMLPELLDNHASRSYGLAGGND